jgi:two-component SAPR family response regulator
VYFGDDLKKLGYQVLDAKNVSSATEYFLNRKIDMIVSDINLGDYEPTGYDFLAKVREKDTKVPFIFTSGYNRRDCPRPSFLARSSSISSGSPFRGGRSRG